MNGAFQFASKNRFQILWQRNSRSSIKQPNKKCVCARALTHTIHLNSHIAYNIHFLSYVFTECALKKEKQRIAAKFHVELLATLLSNGVKSSFNAGENVCVCSESMLSSSNGIYLRMKMVFIIIENFTHSIDLIKHQ